eukprot:TRINITY_DN9471_c0_g1_i1.p1 TRINITY_DN9471_c0_g1~~TRINITY_DN9471_c0_g1_i1.p1  ORF type:complete len:236 (+),score=45.22 TRINITY_DN9471_c0_g1_i1:108-815(+)
MGCSCSRSCSPVSKHDLGFMSSNRKEILVTGLPWAGKSALMQKIVYGEQPFPVNQGGSASQSNEFYSMRFKELTLNFKAISGKRLIQICRGNAGEMDFLAGYDAIVIVIDSVDKMRMTRASGDHNSGDMEEDDDENATGILTASEVIRTVVSVEGAQPVPVLLLANKQDLPGSLTTTQIARIVKLSTSVTYRDCAVVGTSAVTGNGIPEALDWLHQVLITPHTPARGAQAPGGDL